MSEDLDFMILTRSLDDRQWKRTVALFGFRRGLRFAVVTLGLLALAVLLVLTGTVVLAISLAVVAMAIFELCLRGIAAEGPSKKTGKDLA